MKKDNLKLSQSTVEKLGYYVYLLIDPFTNKVFYVGKGKGNRINQHLIGALKDKKETSKIKMIRDIQKKGKEVELVILRHDLNEDEAFQVESSVIDLIGVSNLKNEVKGHHSLLNGITSLQELKIKYEAEIADIKEPSVVININKSYYQGMPEEELYDVTRNQWKVATNKVSKAKLALATYRGIIRGVYEIDQWVKITKGINKGRSYFEGKKASKKYQDAYLHKATNDLAKHTQNPIRYVNIK